jgi:DNA-binding NarL/FixJ family response regulator
MKTIKMTYISSGKTARLECAQVVEQCPNIELVAITFGSDQRDVWMALSRSDIAVIDEELMQHEGGDALVMLLAGNPGVKFLAIMENFNEDRMLWAITQGVRGVILRRELSQLLGKAIKQIHQGEIWMPRNLLNSFRDVMNEEGDCLINTDPAAIKPRLRLH